MDKRVRERERASMKGFIRIISIKDQTNKLNKKKLISIWEEFMFTNYFFGKSTHNIVVAPMKIYCFPLNVRFFVFLFNFYFLYFER